MKKEKHYYTACSKLRRTIESCADRVIYLDDERDGKDEDFDSSRSSIFFPLSKQIEEDFDKHILFHGIDEFNNILLKKAAFYNGYNLTLVWKKPPVVENIGKRLFLVAFFYFYNFDEFNK